LHILTPASATWSPPVVTISGLHGKGLDDLWSKIEDHRQKLTATGEIFERRKKQDVKWMWALVHERLHQKLTSSVDVRKATAEAMVRSAFTAPHASMWTTVDVSASMALVRRLKADRAWAGTRVSPFLIMTRAVVLAVRRHPEVNAAWDEEAQEIVLHPRVNLGIAAATPRGLIVPTIKDAASLGLAELAVTMDSLIKTAREGRTSPAEMSGGTLTITNVGTFGVEGATPILNPPEAVIVALGAVREQPWVVDGEVVVREVMTLSISLDHRLIDGELGALFLAEIAGLLHDPARALL
jgi:pyruvate dehydrogenase E2 component (dihydrolipoamide acetyltransferase)